METLSDNTREILLQAGWNPDNRIDLTQTVKFLEEMGYQVFDPVIEALSLFGGQEYKFKHPDGSTETFHFIPEEAVGDYYEKRTLKNLRKERKNHLL